VRYLLPIPAALVLAACSSGDEAVPQAHTPAELYAFYCADCHQDSGEGSFLRGVPALRYTTLSYRELAEFIRGHHRAEASRMPEFSAMSEQHAEQVAIYVRRELVSR
jgi:mono/diheme cytochrome c family protein